MVSGFEISTSHIIALISITVAFASLGYKIHYDHDTEKKKIGNNIKKSCSQVLAYLERHRYIYSLFYDEIQPTLTDVDALGIKKNKWYVIRDFCWKGMVESRIKIIRLILSENIENVILNDWIVQKGLHVYFQEALKKLNETDMYYYLESLHNCQYIIKNFNYKDMVSSELGNKVREETDKNLMKYLEESEKIIDITKSIVHKVIEEDSLDLVNKELDLKDIDSLFSNIILIKKYRMPF